MAPKHMQPLGPSIDTIGLDKAGQNRQKEKGTQFNEPKLLYVANISY